MNHPSSPQPRSPKRQWASLMPLIIFLTLVAALALNVVLKGGEDSTARAREGRLLGKRLSLTQIHSLTQLDTGEPTLALPADKPVLVNIFASWCTPCIEEVPQLDALRREGAAVVGLAWKDTPENLRRWLANVGNPYSEVRLLDKPELVMQLGMTGIPETLLVKDGKIIWHFAGPLDAERLEQLRPLLR